MEYNKEFVNVLIICKGNRKTTKTFVSIYIYIHITKPMLYIRTDNATMYLYTFTYTKNLIESRLKNCTVILIRL